MPQAIERRLSAGSMVRPTRLFGLVAVLGGLLIGCSDLRTDLPTSAGEAEGPATLEAAASLSKAGRDVAVTSDATEDASAAEQQAATRRSLRSMADAAPFGIADLVNGPAGVRLRVPLSVHDATGPIHGAKQTTAVGTSEVYDLCDDADAYEAYTGEKYSTGDLFPGNTYAELMSERAGMDCDGIGGGADRPRWALRTNDWGGTIRFLTRGSAAAYRDEQFAVHQQRFRNTIDAYPYGIDVNGTGLLQHIEFADRDAPVNDVRVLAGTVTVHDGVVRGLMRNWSRELWAYGATVHADDLSWTWPLSIQPGEIAPFEIAGWDGPADPAEVSLAVTAEMAAEADLSRNWGISGTNGSMYGNANLSDLRGVVPPRVLGTLPQQGTHLLVPKFARWGGAQSHHSVPGSGTGYVPVIDDLRAYVAYIEPRADGLGRPILNEGRHEAAVIDVERLVIYNQLAEGGSAEIERYPLVCIRPGWLDDSLWTLFALPESDHTGWLMWIGAAHPPSSDRTRHPRTRAWHL